MALTINRKILGPQKAAWRRHLPLQGLVSLGEMYLNCIVLQTGSFREQREQDLINLALLQPEAADTHWYPSPPPVSPF